MSIKLPKVNQKNKKVEKFTTFLNKYITESRLKGLMIYSMRLYRAKFLQFILSISIITTDQNIWITDFIRTYVASSFSFFFFIIYYVSKQCDCTIVALSFSFRIVLQLSALLLNSQIDRSSLPYNLRQIDWVRFIQIVTIRSTTTTTNSYLFIAKHW
jgi:hypothetical protein